jgi:ATP-dependent DNA helicase PIF1
MISVFSTVAYIVESNTSTIHSALKIHATSGSFQTLAFNDKTFKENLKKIKILIIDEISMVSSELFSCFSNMFSKLHSNSQSFGGISIIVLGNLFQLPPVSENYVFDHLYGNCSIHFFNKSKKTSR